MNRCRPQSSKEAKSSRLPQRLRDRNSPNPPRGFARSFDALEEAPDRVGSGKLYAVLRLSKSNPGTGLFRPRFGAFSPVFSKGGEIHLLFTTILRKRFKCRNIRRVGCRRGTRGRRPAHGYRSGEIECGSERSIGWPMSPPRLRVTVPMRP